MTSIYGDNTAWVLITDGTSTLYLKCEENPDISESDPSAVVVDYPSRGHFGFTLDSEKVTVKLSKIFCVTKAEWNDVREGLKYMKNNSSTIYLRIKDGASTYEDFDPTASTTVVYSYMPVIIKKINGKKKVFKGDATIYLISQVMLQQSGALTDSI